MNAQAAGQRPRGVRGLAGREPERVRDLEEGRGRHHHAVADGRVQEGIRLAADEECGNPDRIFCKPGLEKTYGFQITVDPLGFGSTTGKEAVVQGKDDVALAGTTDGTLPQLGLVLLEDDKKLQAADNVLPVVNKASAGAPEVAAAPDKLSVLTTEDLAQLNLQVMASARSRRRSRRPTRPPRACSGTLP